MEINPSVTYLLNYFPVLAQPLPPLSQAPVEFPLFAKSSQETEEDSISFGNSTVETEWEQYPFYPAAAVDHLMGSDAASSENSVYPHDGSFYEKDDDFLFDFEDGVEDYVEVCYYKTNKHMSSRRKMKGGSASKTPQRRRRNVFLEAWRCIRKLFMRYLTCRSVLIIVRREFSANNRLWACKFKTFHHVLMKFANRIPRNKVSLGSLGENYYGDPHISAINMVLRRLFAKFIEEKALICVQRLQRVTSTMRDVLLEMVVLIRSTLYRSEW